MNALQQFLAPNAAAANGPTNSPRLSSKSKSVGRNVSKAASKSKTKVSSKSASKSKSKTNTKTMSQSKSKSKTKSKSVKVEVEEPSNSQSVAERIAEEGVPNMPNVNAAMATASKSKSKSKAANVPLSNVDRVIDGYIKSPPDTYEFYDAFLSEEQKPFFEKPIGIYDPRGENLNPLTGQPYQNLYSNDVIKYDSGAAEGAIVPQTYKNWAYIWSNLPLYARAGEIIKSIRENSVTVIKAGTGVGKSFLAGRLCSQAFNFQKKVLMTLPKKLLARKTATDTARTSDVVAGEEVGYMFKGAHEVDKGGKQTMITFTTVGTIVRRLTGEDPYLSDYSCIIIDEAHERSVQTDQLILFLKKAMVERKDLKVVFISATLDLDTFKNYYKDFSFNVVEMGEGTTFPIKEYFEKKQPADWQKTAVEKVMEILKAKKEGDILVFIKSGADANKMRQYLEPQLKTLEGGENPYIGVLEGKSDPMEEKFATEEFAYRDHPDADPSRPYTRKIIFSTNVAESSLTVKGATFVIDCGLALEDLYEPLKDANALLEKFVSQSAIKQRKGRVGRTKPGECYHLYSEAEMNKFPKFPIPSIQKSDLTMDMLDIMKIEYIKNIGDLKKLLGSMMSPPSKEFVDSAVHNLFVNGAITSEKDDGVLTDLGRAISAFSGLSIQQARAVIASYYYHCKYDVIPIVVIMNMIQGRIDGLFLDFRPKGGPMSNAEFKKAAQEYEKKQHKFDSQYGDFMTIHNIYEEFRAYMKIPNELPPNMMNQMGPRNGNGMGAPQMGGGNLNNTNNKGANNVVDIPIERLTRKTAQDAKRWCMDNGISHRAFVDSRNKSSWDKVGNEVRKIQFTLMKLVQPPELKKKYFNEYKKEGGPANKRELDAEIAQSKKEMKSINPEDRLAVDADQVNEPIVGVNGEPVDDQIGRAESIAQSRKNAEMETAGMTGGRGKGKSSVMEGGYKEKTIFPSSIQYGGYNAKPFEINYFPGAVPFEKKEDNIMMALAHGYYSKLAKHRNKMFYETCVPLKSTECAPDRDTTLSMRTHAKMVMYNELFMLREDQPVLKLNVVGKLPTKVLDEVKKLYGGVIEACFKASARRATNNRNRGGRDRGDRKGGKYGDRRGGKYGDRKGGRFGRRDRGDRRGNRRGGRFDRRDRRGNRPNRPNMGRRNNATGAGANVAS